MTQTQTRPPLPFHRCRICAAVDWQGWPTVHRERPPCANTNKPPEEWTE